MPVESFKMIVTGVSGSVVTSLPSKKISYTIPGQALLSKLKGATLLMKKAALPAEYSTLSGISKGTKVGRLSVLSKQGLTRVTENSISSY